jgi:hypothetical protein
MFCPGHVRHFLISAAMGSPDWHLPQWKWSVRRSRVRAHGPAPFAATIAATGLAHRCIRGQACIGHGAGGSVEGKLPPLARSRGLRPGQLSE